MSAHGRARAAWGMTIEGEVATPPPGWWVCPTCGRRRDREGSPATAVWCTGLGWTFHAAAVMTVVRS